MLLFSTLAQATQPWSTQDKLMEMGFTAAIVMDWGQTRDIKRWSAGNHLHEENPILGMHPSHDAINNYFISSLLIHAVIADQLSGKWRTAWQATWIGLEVGTVQRNYALGIRLNF
jgi:hypothetical protein